MVNLDALHLAGAAMVPDVAVEAACVALVVAVGGPQRTRMTARASGEGWSTTPATAFPSHASATIVRSLAVAGVVSMAAVKTGTQIMLSLNVSSGPATHRFVSVAQCMVTLLILAAYLMVLRD